jgi:hypothetical protein
MLFEREQVGDRIVVMARRCCPDNLPLLLHPMGMQRGKDQACCPNCGATGSAKPSASCGFGGGGARGGGG